MIRPGGGWLIIREVHGAFGGVVLPDDQAGGRLADHPDDMWRVRRGSAAG
jgi:hypothetical protein